MAHGALRRGRQGGLICKEKSEFYTIKIQSPEFQRLILSRKKKRCFSMREVPLFDAKRTVSLIEKHRFFDQRTKIVN